MTIPRVLELRHVECESAGAYRAGLEPVADIETVRAWCEPLPDDVSAYAGILVMGGPMGANDGPTVPWIDDELAFLRTAIDAGVPVWGACLGSQLLAKALGGRVWTGPEPELGVCTVELTDAGRADPVWSAVETTSVNVLQWHYDTFELPPGAQLLASSAAFPNQLFRVGKCYGVQFHLEVDTDLIAEWLAIPEYREDVVRVLGPDGPEHIVSDLEKIETVTRAMASAAMSRWISLITSAD